MVRPSPAAGFRRLINDRRAWRIGRSCRPPVLPTALLAALMVALSPARAGRLEGLAELSQPFPLPADALLDVQLLERPAQGGSTLLRGRSRSRPLGRAPFAFIVPYLDGTISTTASYQLRATIHQADRLLFSMAVPLAVNPAAPQPVRLSLQPVGDAPLRGLVWLRAPAASVPVGPEAPRQEQQFRLDPLTRELSGSADCNRFIGSFALEAERLILDPAAGTMLDCEPEVMADEQRFLGDLRKVRRWRLDGQGRLELLDERGEPLLRMETRPG